MSKIAARAKLNRGLKTYGKLTDRFFIERATVNLDFSVLSLLDSKRDFKFYDRKVLASQWRSNIIEGKLVSATPGASMTTLVKILAGNENFINDNYTPPYFYSGNLATFRYLINQPTNSLTTLIGKWKGPNPVFTVDNTGNAGDLLAPGTKLVVSYGGIIHKYTEQGAFDVVYYPSGSVARDAFGKSVNCSEKPMCVGWSPCAAGMKYPMLENFTPATDFSTSTAGCVGLWGAPAFVSLVHQDATYIVFAQWNSYFSTGNLTTYDGTTAGPPDRFEYIAIRKSDGYQYDITLSASLAHVTLDSFSFKSVTTTEATPQKAWVWLSAYMVNQTKTVFLNKIIGATATSVSSANFTNYYHGQQIPTQFMENNNTSFNTHWKVYYPMAGYGSYSSNENSLTFQLVRFNKTITLAPTITPCTLSGIPIEYCSASGDGTKIKAANTPKAWNAGRYDICFAAELYDSGKQYIAYWIGRTRSNKYNTDVDASSYSEVSDTQYRWFLVFEVDATDDSKLTYVSCVPEFKNAKPMHCYATSEDNKYIAMANDDGVYCLVWSTTVKAFICTDVLSLPGVISIGMDGTQEASKGTVFVEVVDDVANADDCASTLYQIDFGNYEDVDLRFYNGSTYIYDFGYNTLPMTVDVNGNYEAKTATLQIRVKNRVDGVESQFVTGKSVKLTISGVRDTDGVSFVDHDAGTNYVKTVSTTGDWLNVTFNYQKPIPQMKISAEIV